MARSKEAKPDQATEKAQAADPVFSKVQLYESKRFRNEKDIIASVFRSDKEYTIKEAVKIIEDFKRKAVN